MKKLIIAAHHAYQDYGWAFLPVFWRHFRKAMFFDMMNYIPLRKLYMYPLSCYRVAFDLALCEMCPPMGDEIIAKAAKHNFR